MAQSILLCDDDSHILRALEVKLKAAGYDVRLACDGEEAWDAILVRRPDLLITDCQMPRLDGLSLIERLRDRPEFAALPVVMLTAKGFEPAYCQRAERSSVFRIVAKPFSPREVAKVAAEALAAAPRSAAEVGA